MLRALITTGATTTHGGVITEGLPNYRIHGKNLHVEGMAHYCPQCKVMSYAIGSHPTKRVHGKMKIVDGDLTTCGAKFIACQDTSRISGGGVVESEKFSIVAQQSESKRTYRKQLQLLDEFTQEPLTTVPYRFIHEGQIIAQGVTDENGFTELIESDEPLNIKVQIAVMNNGD